MPILSRRLAGQAWTPAALPGLQLWLRADLGLYQDSSFTTPAGADADPVGGWRDQSGRGNHLSQATGSKRPVLKLAILSGRPIVRFDGVDDFLNNTGVNLVATGGDRTVLVAGQANATGSGTVVSFRRASPLYVSQYAASNTFVYTDGVVANATIPNALTTIRSPFVGTHRCASNAIAVWLNGVSQTVTSGTVVNTDSGTTGFTVGAREDAATQFWKGDFAEILVCSGALTPTDRARAERYLGARYGVTVV